ncbi:MAG: phenylalanine--tRNA ligase subunit beta [Candidatus Paceibacterota bacterium]
MIFSYNWLQSFFKKKLLKPEKLAEILTMHFAEVEDLKKEGKDFSLDIDVRPNRSADCFSHIGVAREIAAITNSKLLEPVSKIEENKELKVKDFIKVEVRNPSDCRRYTARVVTGVKVGPSPQYIRKALKVCGLRPINNIVDIANYVMLETGQPLHTFDGDKLEGKKIIVRFAKKGERIVTLDGEKYDLDKEVLVIADAEKPVAIAGIKGGKLPEIDEKTNTVVLESANFNPKTVRASSKSIDLKTDASLRFEHGVDPNLTETAINRAAFLIQKIAKGRVLKGKIDLYPRKVLPIRVKLDLSYVKNLLGVLIPEKEVKNILERLGFKVSGSKILNVEVPTRRLDVLTQEDLIEDIGRIYGYQKIPTIFPLASLIPPKRNLNIFWENRVKDILKEMGFNEVYNYSFISEKDAEILNYGKGELVELENPLSSDYQYFRPSLIPNLLKNIANNQKNFQEIKIFELGKIFRQSAAKKYQKPSEKMMLAGALTGDSFYQTKGVIDSLLNKLGISDIWYNEYNPTPEESKSCLWHLKKCAEIKIGREEIGFLGEISSRVASNFKVEKKIAVFDLDFGKLSNLASEESEYRPVSRFPAAVRDIAVLIPRFTKVEEVLRKIDRAGGSLVKDVDLFDIYEGEEIEDGKKNLAFHIIFQSEDKTLSSQEIDLLQNKIIKALEENPEWQVRKQ